MNEGRAELVRRGLWLNYATLAYNSIEAVVALAAGVLSGSVALVGFGFDSVIEVTASGAAQIRLRSDAGASRARVETITRRAISISFFTLAAYVTWDSISALSHREAPLRSWLGLVLLAFSAVVMPLLAGAKIRIANGLGSSALHAEAKQTSLCAYLSVIALAGVGLNALVGWWWADPIAALAMVPVIAREGLGTWRGNSCCASC